MRVLQINTVIGFGSTGKIVCSIADCIEETGNESIIAFGRGKDKKGYKNYKIGNRFDNIIHGLKSFLVDRHGFASKKATQQLVEYIKFIKPDLIQLHNLHGYYLHIGVLFDYLNKSNIPLVWLVHDQWPISGGPAIFQLDKSGNLPSSLDNKESKNIYPRAIWRFNFITNLTDKKKYFGNIDNLTIVTPSKWQKSVFEKSFLSKNRIEVIYNGINLDIFKPRKSSIRTKYHLEGKKIVLAVSSVWNQEKGLDFIINMVEKLDENIQIVMIGLTEKQLKKIPKEIIGITRTENVEQLGEWYTAADVFINPTLFDNFPTVNLEALACGTPVITYDTGGSGESVTKKTGKIISYNDQKAFTNEINSWPIKNSIIANLCRKQAENFDEKKQYPKYINLYNYVISANREE